MVAKTRLSFSARGLIQKFNIILLQFWRKAGFDVSSLKLRGERGLKGAS